MASSIVKLIGDRKKKSGADNDHFTSLTTRLGVKPAVMRSFTLSQVLDHPNLHGAVCTAGIGLVGCEGWVPVLDGIPPAEDPPYEGKLMSFEDWWAAPVLRDSIGNEFSRRFIVETMRDQEDAHTDDALDPLYAGVAYQGAMGLKVQQPLETTDLNPARVVVRQVAHEVLRALDPTLPLTMAMTLGRQVAPIVLAEIQHLDADGVWGLIMDHKAIEIRGEAAPWGYWDAFAKRTVTGTAGQHPPEPANADYRVRLVMVNFGLQPLTVRASLQMQGPAI
jgi:hypothetical protein